MKLFLVRHGECLGQVDPTCKSPDSELTARGLQQAAQTAQRLTREGITHIISSPLVRCLNTASILADGVQCDRIIVWTTLREGWSGPLYRAFGRQELLARFPKAHLPAEITDSGWDHGGDTYPGMFERSQGTLAMLHAEFDDNARVLIVTHGGIGNYLLHVILGIPASAPQWFQMNNCSISQIRYIPAGESEAWPLYPIFPLEVLCLNDISHLTVSETV